MKKNIVVIDSGIGGLYILKGCQKQLPQFNYIYVADTVNAPYGDKSKRNLRKIAHNLIKNLNDTYNPQLFVLECNTLTVIYINYFRKNFNKQFVGVEPALKTARINGGNTIIFATQSTLNSYGKLNRKITKQLKQEFKDSGLIYKNNDRIFKVSIPRLSILIDEHSDKLDSLMPILLKKFNKEKFKKSGNLVLGCTHFMAIKKQLKEILGENIQILDGAVPVSKRVEYLTNNEPGSSLALKQTKKSDIKKQTKIMFLSTSGITAQKNKLKKYFEKLN